jgi:dTDP-4-dehydrorhamnose reductase
MIDRPILITGSKGMLASALRRRFAQPDGPKVPLLWTDLDELDITDPRAVTGFVARQKPGTILNCAGLTNVDACEKDRDASFLVNAEAVRHLARASQSVGARLIQISTDFIFSGRDRCGGPLYREDDRPEPLSVYGQSKLAGEEAAREAPQHLIVRTAWLFGANGRNFVQTICNLAAKGGPLQVVGDQLGCPTYTVDLAEALWRLILGGAAGTVHACGSETASWCEFARAIVVHCRPGTAVLEITSAESGRPARRPSFSALDCTHLFELTGYRLPGYHDSLPRYFAELGEA